MTGFFYNVRISRESMLNDWILLIAFVAQAVSFAYELRFLLEFGKLREIDM